MHSIPGTQKTSCEGMSGHELYVNFAHDLERMHTDSYLVATYNKYLQTRTYTVFTQKGRRSRNLCRIHLFANPSWVFGYSTTEKASEQYDTISTVTEGGKAPKAQTFFSRSYYFLKARAAMDRPPNLGSIRTRTNRYPQIASRGVSLLLCRQYGCRTATPPLHMLKPQPTIAGYG